MEMVQRDPFLEIGPDDAGNLGIEDGEMVMGIPAELIPEIVESLKVVAAAPGSKPGSK